MDKLRQRQETQAYRIVKRHISEIVKAIPLYNMSRLNYEILINLNVKEIQIKEMYRELYINLGKPHFRRAKRNIKRIEIDFETIIINWLSSNSLVRISSVHETLIQTIIDVISNGYDNNLSVVEIARNLQRSFNWYKPQALRIARTETTTATNLSTVLAAQESELVLEKTWISVQDNRTRRPPHSHYDHLDMNGIKVAEDGTFFVSGEVMDYPGDPKAKAGNTINCRCKVAFTVKEDADGLPIRKNNFVI